MSLITVVHIVLQMQISQQIFEKIRNDPNAIIKGLGQDDSRNKPKAKNLSLYEWTSIYISIFTSGPTKNFCFVFDHVRILVSDLSKLETYIFCSTLEGKLSGSRY